ncbi:MAG: hypothetical protein HYR88_12130 [Verrucomicrobia bacterium]|nr:hypothetical protein [Verrucomicrobiota bacterium]MBI3869395.1 hypothetical protein [Verrucomicrobiota bacterium]
MNRRACLLVFLALALTVAATPAAETPLTSEQTGWLQKARRFERKGWVYLHMEGDARARGFQHGYLLASEIAQGLRKVKVGWEYQSAMTWPWLVEKSARMFASKIDGENLAEMEGIAAGLRAKGLTVTRDEIIAYNGIIELAGYWWPTEERKMKEERGPAHPVKESCSAFIATGSMTRDGNVVLGHNTMSGYADVLPNVIADIVPDHGRRILWQACAGWIHSGMDFFITDAGLVGAETTIGGFEGFDPNGVPEFTRMRRATQDATTIDEWCDIMKRGNNGGYANAWLVGSIRTKEIARLELGLKYVGFERTRDGFFIGSNVAEDPKILRFETSAHETDIRASSVARRVRWKQLMRESKGKIDLSRAKAFEADHYDSYLGRVAPDGRTLCGHFELDREPAGPWPGVPFGCAGTLDAKVVDARMASNMSFAARWGSACGRAFNADRFLRAHPQFDWMKGVLSDRPSEPWADFQSGE